ncbi:MAG: RdgB/HAM1 family non-canonical purine NTP pyrophosphatase [Bacteroidota bacterium]
MDLIFCSGNKHKASEIQLLMPDWLHVKSMREVGVFDDIIEDGTTFEENALIKARYVAQKSNLPVFSDDSGLVVDTLNGGPGIYSARYAGPDATSVENVQKLLTELKGVSNRKAHFVCVIALIINGKEMLFDGRVDGLITQETVGVGGFGYDPIFIPDGYRQTFAELDSAVKNRISHRALAVKKMVEWLQLMRFEKA